MSNNPTSESAGIGAAPLGLLVVQPTTFCNIDCRYCYLGHRAENHRMSSATVQAVARFIRDIPLRDPQLAVVWHAGEPLTLPLDFYEAAFRTLQAEAAPVRIEHHIQTNATLVSDEWCSLFKRWSVRVGVSIDGPKPINDAHRIDRAGRGTYDKVMRGIGTLREHSISFTAIGVLTQDSLCMPEDIWGFFEALGATQVAFNVEEQEGTNLSSSFSGQNEEQFRAFVRRITQLRLNSPVGLRMRELDGMRGHLSAPPGSEVERADLMPGAIINIDYDGNVTTFSPELLGATHETYGKFAWGNVHRQGWNEVLSHPGFRKAFDDIQAGIERCRETCAYFSVCGGGNPSNKLSELGTFRGTETQYCRLHVQAFADIVLEELEQELSSDKVEKSLTSERGGSLEGRQANADIDIYLTGAGIAFPDHLTVETIDILTSCKRVATNLQERDLEGLPQDLKDKCISLWSLYQDRRVRTENYNDVFNAIVEMAEIERPIAWLTPGHPVIFDSVTAALLKEGKSRGWNVRVVPAISSIDTMLAELGYDPAHGMLIHECTGLVRRRIPLDRTVAAMLLQPAVFDVHVAIIKPGGAGPDLSPLRDYICQFHSPDHTCAFIRSASKVGERDLVTWTALRDMASVPYERVAGSTLFVPPAG